MDQKYSEEPTFFLTESSREDCVKQGVSVFNCSLEWQLAEPAFFRIGIEY